jgi:hypothetical protein
LDKIKNEIAVAIEKDRSNPLQAVISIYRIGLDNLKRFSPSFIMGLQKYYPTANELFNEFRDKEVHDLVLKLLQQGQVIGQIRKNVNLELTCELYLNRLEFVLFSTINLFDKYSKPVLLEHLIINNLRGIATESYARKLS